MDSTDLFFDFFLYYRESNIDILEGELIQSVAKPCSTLSRLLTVYSILSETRISIPPSLQILTVTFVN